MNIKPIYMAHTPIDAEATTPIIFRSALQALHDVLLNVCVSATTLAIGCISGFAIKPCFASSIFEGEAAPLSANLSPGFLGPASHTTVPQSSQSNES